jgi:hypothetical protein
MATAVPRQKQQGRPAQLAADDDVAGRAERSIDVLVFQLLEARHVVDAAATDDTEYGLHGGPLPRSAAGDQPLRGGGSARAQVVGAEPARFGQQSLREAGRPQPPALFRPEDGNQLLGGCL